MNRQSTKITALYCRIANPVQNTDKLAQQAQMDVLSRYAEKNGLENTEFFCDWGLLTYEHRPSYQRMMREIKVGHVSAIVVSDISRFERRLPVFLDQLEILRDKGVTLHCIREGILSPQAMTSIVEANKNAKSGRTLHQERGRR